MRWYNSILILLMLAITPVKTPAQYISPDSLKKLINNAKADIIKTDAMNWLSFRYYQSLATDSAQFWAEKALSLSTKINYKSGIGFAYINIGNIKILNPEKLLIAAADYQKAIKVLEEAGDKGFMGIAYSNLAVIYDEKENYAEGLRNLYKALRLQTESGFEFGLAHCYLIWGMHYLSEGDYMEAHKNLQQATNLFKKLGENHLLSNSYLYKGDANLGLGNYQLALSDYNAGKEVYKELGDPFWLKAKYFWCIAGVLENQGDSCLLAKNKSQAAENYDKSEKNYRTALNYAEKQDIVSLQALYNNLGRLYQKQKKNHLAKTYFIKSISITGYNASKNILSSSYLGLSVLDSIEGKLSSAYYNYKKHILYRDSVFSEENARKKALYKIEFEFEKKEGQIKLLTTENSLKTLVAAKEKQQKNFALASIGIIVLAGGYTFFRYRKKRKQQSEQEISNERLRISQELHDEVGATLSGISMYSHLTKEQMKHAQTAEVEKSLNIMQQSAGEMVNKLNDIVWLINPGHDTLQKLIQRLEEYAGEMTAIKNIKLQTSVPENLSVQNLPVESRRNIYLFCKEAINNAVKYSEAGLLELSVKENNSELQIAISDNGKGFDADAIKRGNGLNNMQKRADELGAGFNIQSKTGAGCRISLKLKITQ